MSRGKHVCATNTSSYPTFIFGINVTVHEENDQNESRAYIVLLNANVNFIFLILLQNIDCCQCWYYVVRADAVQCFEQKYRKYYFRLCVLFVFFFVFFFYCMDIFFRNKYFNLLLRLFVRIAFEECSATV